MPRINVRDIDLYYDVHGSPDGEPLVLLHGFTSSGKSFAPFVDKLSASHRVYNVDWRGHGRTTNPKDEILHLDLAHDVAAFLQAVGLKSAHFCGHSSGGMLLLLMSLEFPAIVRSLIIVGATYTFDDHAKDFVRSAISSDNLAAEEWVQGQKHHHEEFHGPDHIMTLVRQWSESVFRPGELDLSASELSQIQCPTLVVHGDRDMPFPVGVPAFMYGSIPNAELSIVPNCGHNVLGDSPALFLQVIQAFLGRVAKGTS